MAAPLRHNEHLAVLIPRTSWKPDSSAILCDNIECRIPFSIVQRRHHCRKCGDVFCAKCSSRKTALLDTTNLSFLHPPRHTPIATYESPCSPVVDARVCDRCWRSIHGASAFSSACASPASSSASTSDASTAASSSIHTPSTSTAASPKRRIRATSSLPTISASAPQPTPIEESLGELDAYPLRWASEVCKAQGGGRWRPQPARTLTGFAVPTISTCREKGRRVVFDGNPVQRRKSKETVVHDGDFRVLPRSPIAIAGKDEEEETPEGLGIGGIPRSFHLSTF